MKKLFFGLIVTVAMVCLINVVPSTAADKAKFIGEESHGIDGNAQAQDVRRGVDGLNYSKENYTALAPSSGESYNKSAHNVFNPGETVRLIDRFYIATAGSYTRYYFITDVVGTMILFSGVNFSIGTTGHYWGTKSIVFNAKGSYVYSSLTLGPGEYFSSKQFPFIVE